MPKSTLSNWLKDVALTAEQQKILSQSRPDGVRRRAEAIRSRRIAEQERVKAEARAEIGGLSDRELFIAGVVAYWAEGAKAKPWRDRSPRVKFINSDPTMIMLFLHWLDSIGIEPDRLTFRVHIHETADVGGALRFWADLVGVAPSTFLRTTLKRHNPTTSRRNTGEGYVGCLTIEVRRSTHLYRQIAGWYEGVVESLGRGVSRRAREALVLQVRVRVLAPQRQHDARQERLFERPMPYLIRARSADGNVARA